MSGNENPITITMNEDKAITALFVRGTADGNLVLNGDFSSGSEEWTPQYLGRKCIRECSGWGISDKH